MHFFQRFRFIMVCGLSIWIKDTLCSSKLALFFLVSIPASRSSLSNVVPACVPLSRNLRSSTTTNVVGTNSQFRQTLSQLKQEIVEDPAIKDEFESKGCVHYKILVDYQIHKSTFFRYCWESQCTHQNTIPWKALCCYSYEWISV